MKDQILVRVFNRLRIIKLSTRAWFSTKFTYVYAGFYGIHLEKGCKFWKKTTFYTEPGARINIGKNCFFRSDQDSNLIGVNHRCIISAHSAAAVIKIGNNCGFSGSSIGAKESIEIGDNVLVGANSIITDFDWHSLDPADRNNKEAVRSKRVIIGDNVWIGANCLILKGVTIGKNAIIGAGSIVTGDLPENSICGGNPCKVLRMS
jgi:acetyltransferase-like isoleucine patch superfamily enzyme